MFGTSTRCRADTRVGSTFEGSLERAQQSLVSGIRRCRGMEAKYVHTSTPTVVETCSSRPPSPNGGCTRGDRVQAVFVVKVASSVGQDWFDGLVPSLTDRDGFSFFLFSYRIRDTAESVDTTPHPYVREPAPRTSPALPQTCPPGERRAPPPAAALGQPNRIEGTNRKSPPLIGTGFVLRRNGDGSATLRTRGGP